MRKNYFGLDLIKNNLLRVFINYEIFYNSELTELQNSSSRYNVCSLIEYTYTYT